MYDLMKRYPALISCREDIDAALGLFIKTYEGGGKALVCGNGGSASDSGHIVGELMKGFKSRRRVSDNRLPEEIRAKLQGALPAISLVSQEALISAFSNDADAEYAYAQQVYGYGKEGDLFIGISTSGNSKNIVAAAKTAKALGLYTLALTGESESLLSQICDVTVRVPEKETYKVQELHLPVYHYLCAETEKRFFGGEEK